MKIRLLFATLLGTLVFVPFTHADETELSAKMDKMGSAFRTLRRQVSDSSKNQDSLAKVAIIQENAKAALQLEPEKKADLPVAEQAKFVADYRAKMKDFIGIADQLAAALKAGDNTEASRLLGVMADTQKQAHGDFQRKKKKQDS